MSTWIVNLDHETARIRPGLQAPPPVTLQWKITGDADAKFVHCQLDPQDGRAWYEWALTHPDILLTGHNIAYDMCVAMAQWPSLARAIFQAYLDDRVVCTLAREKLRDIGNGTRRINTYDLASVAKRNKLSVIPDKDDPWRLRYWELRGTPIAEFPAEAVEYMKLDVDCGLELAQAQKDYPDQYRQARADLWLKLATCWGMMTDPEQVERYYEATKHELIQERDMLQDVGLVRLDGSKDTKAARRRYLEAADFAGVRPRLTDAAKEKMKKGATREDVIGELLVSVSKDAVEETGDAVLEAYARFSSHTTILSRVERLKHGAVTPIQPSFDSLVDTGRTSCRQGDVKPGKEVMAWGAQVQNVHRKAGLRECMHARPGMAYIAIDYKGAELNCVSQINVQMHRDLGLPVSRVKMAETINSGRDVHLWFGGKLLGIDYEEAVSRMAAKDPEIKEKRQVAKAADFGIPGGLGVSALMRYVAGYGVILTEKQAKKLKADWLRAFSEFEIYFKWVRSKLTTVGKDDEGKEIKRLDVTHPYSFRKRGRIPFTVACNGFFQGLCADMTKDAGFRISMECYADPTSPLYGFRIVNFIHDEIIIEGPRERCHEAAVRMRDIMEEAGRTWCPDVPVKVDVSLMKRWTKGVPDNTIDPTSGMYIPNEEMPGYDGMPARW